MIRLASLSCQTIAAAALFLLLPDQSFGQTSASVERQPQLAPPSASAVKEAAAKVREVFRQEFANATSPEASVNLARMLLAQVANTPASSERWALCVEAMRLAADAGDIEATFEAIAESERHFAIDADAFKLDALAKLSLKAPPQAIDELARESLAIAKRADDIGKLQIAAKSLSLAAGFARKAKNPALLGEVSNFQKLAREREKEAKEMEGIKAKLATDPDDPEICLTAGKYFCFKANEWESGLPLLAKGSDSTLKRLARAESQAPASAAALTKIADEWWTWGERQKGGTKSAALSHAADLYSTVITQTSGLERARLEKRVREAQSDTSASKKKIALADLPEASSAGIQYGLTKDGTFRGRPFTCAGERWPKALMAMTHEKGTSIIYDVPPGAKMCVGKAGVFSPDGVTNGDPDRPIIFEILVDGKTAWKSGPLPKRNDMVDFEVFLSGASRLELRTVSQSASSAWAAWLNPCFAF